MRCDVSGRKFLSAFYNGDYEDIEIKNDGTDERLAV